LSGIVPQLLLGDTMPKHGRFHREYEGEDVRRSTEHEDGAMMPSGHGQHANMPQEVVMREFGKSHYGMPENLNDGMGGIDKQIGTDEGDLHKRMKPKKV
jgi:hypothetical protein